MPTYIHSYLRVAPSKPDQLVLARTSMTLPMVATGLGVTGLGLGSYVANGVSEYPAVLYGAAAIMILMALVFAYAALPERVTFDRGARTLTMGNGDVVSFASIQRLVVLMDKDSEGDVAWGLGIDTAAGERTLSRMWCWDEAEVRAAAAAIHAAFPDLPFSPDARYAR